MPKTIQPRAQRLLDYIQSHGSGILNYDRNGELIYKGLNIPQTHIVDLLKDVLIKTKSFHPKGIEEFVHGLADINTPESLLSNMDKRALLRDTKGGLQPVSKAKSYAILNSFMDKDTKPKKKHSFKLPGIPLVKENNEKRAMMKKWIKY